MAAQAIWNEDALDIERIPERHLSFVEVSLEAWRFRPEMTTLDRRIALQSKYLGKAKSGGGGGSKSG